MMPSPCKSIRCLYFGRQLKRSKINPGAPSDDPGGFFVGRGRRLGNSFVIALMIFAGINLRPAIVSVAPLLGIIQKDLALSTGAAGLLTGLPVLLLGVASPFAAVLVRYLSLSRAAALAMALLAIGIVIRSLPTTPGQAAIALWCGTIIIGAGMGFANTLMPAVIKRLPEYLRNASTAALSFAICLGGAMAAATAGPMRGVLAAKWELALSVWAIPAALCALVWWFLHDSAGRSDHSHLDRSFSSALWRDPLALALCAHMSMQSLLSHSVSSWLPTILVGRGLSEAAAGAMLSALMAAQLVTALMGVWIASRANNQQLAVTAMYVLALVGFTGAVYAGLEYSLISAVVLGLGQGGTFSIGLLMIIRRSATPLIAMQLSALTQLAGYTVASTGPFLLGIMRDYYGSWTFITVLFAIVTILGMVAGLYAGQNRQIGLRNNSS